MRPTSALWLLFIVITFPLSFSWAENNLLSEKISPMNFFLLTKQDGEEKSKADNQSSQENSSREEKILPANEKETNSPDETPVVEDKEEIKKEVKAEDKEEIKEEVKAEDKEEIKEEVKADDKTETKADDKEEEIKEEAKAEAKEEAKAEAKKEAKAEAKKEDKAEAKEEIKEEVKAEAKKEDKAEAKEEIKEEVKAEAKEEIKKEDKAENKEEDKADDKTETKADDKEEDKTEAKAQDKAEAKKDQAEELKTPKETRNYLQELQSLPKKPEAIPSLIDILETVQSEEIQSLAVTFLSKVKNGEGEIKAWLLLSQSEYGSVQKAIRNQIRAETIEQMRKMLLDENSPRKNIASFLAERGTKEVITFAELLGTQDKELRNLVIDSLVSIGIPTITILLKEHEKYPSVGLVDTFQKMSTSAVPAMILTGKETDDKGRDIIVDTLAAMGVPALKEAIRILQIDQSSKTQHVISSAAVKIGEDILPFVLSLLQDPFPMVKGVAHQYVKKMGKKTLPALLELLESKDQEKNRLAMLALGNLGEEAHQVIPIIKPFLLKEGDLQVTAALSLENFSYNIENSPKVKSALIDCMQELMIAFGSRDWQVRAAVTNTLGYLGKDSVRNLPRLTSQFYQEEYGDVRVAIVKTIGNMQSRKALSFLIQALQDQDGTVVKTAAESLGKLGQSARKAVKPLIRVLVEWGMQERIAAAKALSQIGRSTIQELRRTLRFNEEYAAREGAAMALGYMGPVARSAVDSLIVALKFDEDIVKVAAAEALGKIGPAPGHRDIIALINAVQNEHDVVREVAGQSLLKLGDPCIPHLIRQMRRGTPEARIALVRILGQLGENASPAVASLRDCLRLWQGAPLHEVVRTIGKIGPKAEATIPELIELFKREQEPQVQALISDTLLVFENKIIPSLIPLLNFPKENVQKNTSSILQKLGDAVFPHMVDIVEKSEDEDLICIAIEILSKNLKSLPILLNNLKHDSNKIRQAVIQALAKIKEPAIEGIIKVMVKTKISYEQEACSSALAEMGVIAVNPLVQVLNKSENQSARLAAIESLFKIGFEAKDAIGSLIEAIKKRQGIEQVQVARCLGNMGEIAIPHLLKLLEEKDKSIRQSVIFALAETNSEDAVRYLLSSLEKNPELLSLIVNAMLKLKGIAVPILISSLSHKNEYIRFASAASLSEIASPQAIANLARQSTQEENPMIRYILQIALRNCQEKIKEN